MRDLLGRDVCSTSVLLGAALVGGELECELLMCDEFGRLWRVTGGTRRDLVRFCMARCLRVFSSLGSLVDSMQRGFVLGLLSTVAPGVAVLWRS